MNNDGMYELEVTVRFGKRYSYGLHGNSKAMVEGIDSFDALDAKTIASFAGLVPMLVKNAISDHIALAKEQKELSEKAIPEAKENA